MGLTSPLQGAKDKDKEQEKDMDKDMDKEQESETQINFGEINKSQFVIVLSKYASDRTSRINGKFGLSEFMESKQTILNNPDKAEAFLIENNGFVFNDFSHLQNAYKKFSTTALPGKKKSFNIDDL